MDHPNGRLAELDVLRGGAILGVLAIHTAANFAGIKGITPVAAANIVVDVVVHYAVPLFILISGYVLALRYQGIDTKGNVWAFYRRRLVRIVPPYLVFSAFYLAVRAFRGTSLTAGAAAFDILTGDSEIHLWYVVLIIQLYLLFPGLAAILRRAEPAGRTWVLPAGALVIQLAWNIGTLYLLEALPSTETNRVLLSYRFFPSHLFYFVIGMWIARRVWSPLQRSKMAALALVAVSLTALTSAAWISGVRQYAWFFDIPHRYFVPTAALEPMLYLAMCGLLWQGAARLVGVGSRQTQLHSAASQALAHLGVYSFGIYLIHMFFQWVVARLLARAGIGVTAWAFYPSVFFLSLLLSYGAVRVLSWLPYSNHLVGSHDQPPAWLPARHSDSHR